MILNFSNASRYFDESRGCVCFWGYDSTIEVSFYVAAEALQLLCPEIEKVESGFLQAFDTALDQIHKVADKVYMRGGKGKGAYAYTLAAEDF